MVWLRFGFGVVLIVVGVGAQPVGNRIRRVPVGRPPRIFRCIVRAICAGGGVLTGVDRLNRTVVFGLRAFVKYASANAPQTMQKAPGSRRVVEVFGRGFRDFAVGWSTSGSDEYYFSSDYLFHMYDVIKIQNMVTPLYFGGGVRYINREKKDNKFGLRISDFVFR
ncbi:MAG: hypothetical protein ACWGPN_14025 [Gammaproteobacteria bacterium]